MADYQSSTTVSAPPDALFTYLSDVENLPGYFARMKEAHRTTGDEVHTEAVMPDGQTVEGEAWFRIDDSTQRISWGSEGENDYSGYLDVSPADDGSRVEVHIHSPHVASDQVQQGVDQTLATIKDKVEEQGAGQG
jgi:uncharacterized membrane protein